MLLLLLVQAISKIYSIDLGHKNIRIAVGTPGQPVELFVDSHHGRSTKNFFFISNSSFSIGAAAEKNGIQNIFDFTHELYYSSLFLKKLLPFFHPKKDKLVLIIPPDFSLKKRQKLIESTLNINFTSTQLFETSSSVALLYTLDRLKKNTTKRVMFCDIGDTKTDISIWLLNSTSIHLLQRKSKILGGSNIDNILLKYVEEKSDKTFPALSLRKSILKAKESLVSLGESVIELPDDGLSVFISNNLLCNLSHLIIDEFEDLLSGFKDVDEIELIGGSSRLPLFVSCVQKAFPDVPILRSMNSDEAIVFGGAYFGLLQEGFLSDRIEVLSQTNFGLQFELNGKKTDVYSANEDLSRKSVTLRKYQNFNFTVSTSNHEEFHFELFLNMSTFNITNSSIPVVKLSFGRNPTLDCLDFISANLHANVLMYDKDIPTSFQLKTRLIEDKENTTLLHEYLARDEEQKEHAKAVDEALRFINDLNEKLEYDPDFVLVSTEEEIRSIKKALSAEHQILELSGNTVSSVTIRGRLSKLKSTISLPLTRFEEYKGRTAIIPKLNATIKKAEKMISQKQYGEVQIAEINVYLEKIKSLMLKAQLVPPREDSSITTKELQQVESNLIKTILEIAHTARISKTQQN